jgi:hypothetical protein
MPDLVPDIGRLPEMEIVGLTAESLLRQTGRHAGFQ